MAAIQIKTSPTLLRAIVEDFFSNQSIYLGLITSGNEINQNLVETTPEAFRSIEYNSGPWVRPSMAINPTGNDPGSFNAGLDKWDFPSDLQWSFVGPVGGLSVKQIVLIAGGSSTPRSTSGIIVGVATYTTPLVVAAGVTQVIEAPWAIA